MDCSANNLGTGVPTDRNPWTWLPFGLLPQAGCLSILGCARPSGVILAPYLEWLRVSPGCNIPVLSHARLLSHDARRHSGPLLLSSAVPSTQSSRRTGERVGADAGRQLFAGHVFDGIGLLVLLFDCARGYG